jgi:cytochrome P450
MAPLDPIAAVTHADPYRYYQALVAERPLYRDDALGLWVASSAAAVTAVLESKVCRVRPVAEPVPSAVAASPAGEIFGALVRMNDGARHAAMKPAVMRALAGIDSATVAEAARDWLDRTIAERGEALCHGTLDEIIFELPVAVVASLLGVPQALIPVATAAIGDFVRCIAPGSSDDQLARGKRAAADLLAMFKALRPGAGLLRSLRDEMGDDADGFVIANAIGFLFQTHDATAGLIGNALLAARAHRDAYQRAGDSTRLQAFVHEVLRFDPPVQNTRRFPAEDAVVAGQAMRAGDAVLLVLAAANRDAAANPEPERFDIDRPAPTIFTFGLGRHACPGETIATAVAAAAVERLAPCLTDLDRMAEGVTYRASANARIPVFGGRTIAAEPATTATGGYGR